MKRLRDSGKLRLGESMGRLGDCWAGRLSDLAGRLGWDSGEILGGSTGAEGLSGYRST